MCVIFRICGNESQPGLQLVERASGKAGYAPGRLSCTDPLSLYLYLYKQKVPKEQSFHKTEAQNLYKTKLSKKKINECPNWYYYQLSL